MKTARPRIHSFKGDSCKHEITNGERHYIECRPRREPYKGLLGQAAALRLYCTVKSVDTLERTPTTSYQPLHCHQERISLTTFPYICILNKSPLSIVN